MKTCKDCFYFSGDYANHHLGNKTGGYCCLEPTKIDRDENDAVCKYYNVEKEVYKGAKWTPHDS